jgi:hypothetical protein
MAPKVTPQSSCNGVSVPRRTEWLSDPGELADTFISLFVTIGLEKSLFWMTLLLASAAGRGLSIYSLPNCGVYAPILTQLSVSSGSNGDNKKY